MKSRPKPGFSARKGRQSRLSPHTSSAPRAISPQVNEDARKRQESERNAIFLGHADNYTTLFNSARHAFWEAVDSLVEATTDKSIKKRAQQGYAALEQVPWPTNRGYLLTHAFSLRFMEAVRDRNFPKRHKARAHFLGDSLGVDREVGARRSRDICGQERTKAKREAEKLEPEIYIMCCGKKKWTVKRICPTCGKSPFPFSLSIT